MLDRGLCRTVRKVSPHASDPAGVPEPGSSLDQVSEAEASSVWAAVLTC